MTYKTDTRRFLGMCLEILGRIEQGLAGWLSVRIMCLSGISDHGAGDLVSFPVGQCYKVITSAHCHKSEPAVPTCDLRGT